MLVIMVKYIGFYVYHRSYSLWSPVIAVSLGYRAELIFYYLCYLVLLLQLMVLLSHAAAIWLGYLELIVR